MTLSMVRYLGDVDTKLGTQATRIWSHDLDTREERSFKEHVDCLLS